jgi:hypothetical protein
MRLKIYFKNKDEFVQYKNTIKLISCPNPKCQNIGNLVFYGPLKNKGHRCFCSNRFKKNGCGKTFSFLWGKTIKNHTVKTKELWQFLIKLLCKQNITKALRSSEIIFSRRAVNHWITKLNTCQSTIRNYLVKISSPPTIHTSKPLLQTIEHLKTCFKNNCPIQSYQTYFQRSIFEK